MKITQDLVGAVRWMLLDFPIYTTKKILHRLGYMESFYIYILQYFPSVEIY